MKPLSDKTVVVTGASKGIGAAIATALIENGARIVAGATGKGPRLRWQGPRRGRPRF